MAMKKLFACLLACLVLGVSLLLSGAAVMAQTPTSAVPEAALSAVTLAVIVPVPRLDSGDTAWMLTSTLLWAVYGYRLTFGGEGLAQISSRFVRQKHLRSRGS